MKRKLSSRELSLGSWITLAHPAIAEIMCKAGFEWLVVDLEHSVITVREAEELIRVIDLCGSVPLVRLSANDPIQIKRMMDAGARGVIVPMVNSREEAEQAVRSVYYPPRGARGVGLARAQGYGTGFEEYTRRLDTDTIVIPQIEHVLGVEALSDILSVDGVDGFIVGPYDLSGSLGIPGAFDHPKMTAAMERIRSIGARAGKSAGLHVVEPEIEALRRSIEEGYTFVAYSLDIRMLDTSCRQALRDLG